MTLRVSRAHARTLIPDVLALLAEDRIHPERITTLQAPIDDAAEVLTCHLAGQSIKTVLTA